MISTSEELKLAHAESDFLYDQAAVHVEDALTKPTEETRNALLALRRQFEMMQQEIDNSIGELDAQDMAGEEWKNG